jgi:hypothetical protein
MSDSQLVEDYVREGLTAMIERHGLEKALELVGLQGELVADGPGQPATFVITKPVWHEEYEPIR